jgi:porphobilinogen synthase
MQLRRLRRTTGLRGLNRECEVRPSDLILPVFVSEVDSEPTPIPSMPGVNRWPVEEVASVTGAAADAGLAGVILFGIPAEKDSVGSQAWDEEGVIQKALGRVRSSGYDGVLVTDVCLCEYTDHGHCGLVAEDGRILHPETADRLGEVAVSHARAGADVVAPSAMMDGQVAAIRASLDRAGFDETPILAYSAKYASAFYGPFRDAADGAPSFGDRRSHQMDPANGREAILEHRQDVIEGADILMVKPGLSYLDIVRRTREAFPHHPLAAYNVSGEYSMVKAASEKGWLDERSVVLETLLSFRRAGADLVISYHALEAARWINETEVN